MRYDAETASRTARARRVAARVRDQLADLEDQGFAYVEAVDLAYTTQRITGGVAVYHGEPTNAALATRIFATQTEADAWIADR